MNRPLPQVGLVLLLGVVTGVVWSQVADPPAWRVVGNRLQLTEEASTGRFHVVLMFVLVGAVASVLWAMLETRLLGAGWQQVVTVVLGSLAAALLCWQIGIALGPPDPTTVAGLADGDIVPDRLAVDSVAAFLVWPMAALVGVLVATWSRSDEPDQPQTAIDDDVAFVDDTRS